MAAVKRCRKMGLPDAKLPMSNSRAGGGASINFPMDVGDDLVITSNASAAQIRDWISQMLLELGKPQAFAQIQTRSGKLIALPE